MNLILRDYLRRWWWVWALGLPVNAAMLVSECVAHQRGNYTSFFPLGLFLGSILLAMDLQRGGTRVLLSLPVTVGQLARIWWLEAVALPAVAILLVNTAVFLVLIRVCGMTGILPVYFKHTLTDVLMLGVMFFTLTGLPAGQLGESWAERARATFFSLLWGVSFGGWYFFARLFDYTTPTGRIAMVIAGVLGVWGWARAELLVQVRAGVRLLAPNLYLPGSSQPARPSRCAEGAGGFGYLVRRTYGRMMLMGLGLIALMVLFSWFAVALVDAKAQFMSTARMMTTNPMLSNGFVFQWLLAMQMLPVCLHIRFLRTLPVSSTWLAAYMVFTPLAAILSIAGIFGALLAVSGIITWTDSLTWIGQVSGLSAGVVTLFIPILLWRGFNRFTWVLIMAVIMGSSFGQILSIFKISLAVSDALSILFIISSFVLTKLAMERSSLVYRPRTITAFGTWGVGGGR